MRKGSSFDALLDSIAALGEEERAVVEESKMIANIIQALICARHEAGLSQRALANKCGMNQAMLARIESIRVSPRLDTLVHIARVLGQEISVKTVAETRSFEKVTALPLSNLEKPYAWSPLELHRTGVNTYHETAC